MYSADAFLIRDARVDVAADVSGAPYLLANMRARAAGILAHRRTPSVAERMHATVAVDA